MNNPLHRLPDFSQLTSNQRHIHLEDVKYCEDAGPRSQLEVANQRHCKLCQHPRQAAANASLHTILRLPQSKCLSQLVWVISGVYQHTWKNPVALKILVWSRRRLATLQIFTSSSFSLEMCSLPT